MLEKKLKRFNELLNDYNLYNRCETLFHWDQAIGAPKGGVSDRSEWVGKLNGRSFGILTSDEMKELIYYLDENKSELDEISSACVRDVKRFYDANNKIPKDLMEEYSRFTSVSKSVWEEAKNKSDYNLFKPYLEKIIDYNKKFIDYRGFNEHPYNTLLDDYEHGITVSKLDVFFEILKKTIVPLLKKITSNDLDFDKSFLTRDVSIEKQRKFSDYLMKILGFDFNRGIIKESEHPFTTGFGRNDVRITTHYYKNDVLSSMYSVIHETGHAIYEQNYDDKLNNTFVGNGISMGIHESQSRFFENIIGRNKNFWKFIYPEFINIFKDEFSDVSYEQLFIGSNLVKPSFIRIDADELTYSLHIMVRYEVEKAIFSDDLSVDDIKEMWNDKYKEYLGIYPDDDKFGILQDVHWSDGSFGYFPSYSLGNAYAAQLLHYMSKDFEIDIALQSGNFEKIKNWLTEKIHIHGSLKYPNELMLSNFKEELNAQYYVDYLVEKFNYIYNL